jgi:CheY-like chemotaxis protein
METSSALRERNVILAVDDDEDDIDLMRLLFRKAGIAHPVEVYRQGEQLIDVLSRLVNQSGKTVLPLLCFLDVKMPSISGHELLNWIRKQRMLDAVSVVMLSSSEHPDDIKRAADEGAQCYLAKYPHPTVLKRVFEEALRVANNGSAPAQEWFGLPANLLLRWGLVKVRT